MTERAPEPGLYESFYTESLARRLEGSPWESVLREIDPADQPEVIARHVADAVRQHLPAGEAARVEFVSRLMAMLDAVDEQPIPPLRQLVRLSPAAASGVREITTIRPSTPLADVALLTNAPGEPGLGHELKAEMASADRIDLLCAFVQWYGLRFLEDELREASERGVPIRVVTTTYIGGTDRLALDRLIEDFGAEIRVQYDARVARLHAKAWLFRRNSGFDTAYVGSSNLSRVALLDGAEWNVRLSANVTGHLLDKFEATFDSYWESEQFEPYRGAEDAERLDQALAAARGGIRDQTAANVVSGLEVRPYPYQEAILAAVRAERENHDRHRNLIVAATGTGKTVIAALDYRSLCALNHRPRLLFVAHRREILTQARRTYREVLGDANFGELFVDGDRPTHWRHVFASMQSLASKGVETIDPRAFDVVVIDEFHHAQAATYRLLLDRLEPSELLGLTATPERGDGLDVREFFGGRIAAELRIWDAIQQGLLAPFHYFGINDETDLSHVTWQQGHYDSAELEHIYTGNDRHASLVLGQVGDKVLEPRGMRALGFCVNVAHARFMAKFFTDAGIPSVLLTGSSSTAERGAAVEKLRAGEISAILTVDIFNEGVDIPEIDTILLLRPTESPTVFLQQLGRGLRLSPGKAVLTVLDFVGQHRKEFRLDLRFRALTGHRGAELLRQVEQQFPLLPSGCQIVLDRVAQNVVLNNLRANLRMRRPQLVHELREAPTPSLREFLQDNRLDLSSIVRSGIRNSWASLRADAGLVEPPSPREAQLLRRVRAFTHVDDPLRAQTYRQLVSGGFPSPEEQHLADMLFYSLWPDGGGFATTEEGLATLHDMPLLRDDVAQVVDYVFSESNSLTTPLPGSLAHLPLHVHGSYSREEILAGIGYARPGRPPSQFREGVLHAVVGDDPIDVFFITLKKSETEYSPTTLYRDYPINRRLFHWESQSTTSVHSPTGQRYLNGTSTPLLFVRQQKDGDFGTSPYVFLGDASYVSHTGDRPIAITWRLTTPMPPSLFADTAIMQ